MTKYSDREDDEPLITPDPSTVPSTPKPRGTRRRRRTFVIEPLVALYVISVMPLGSVRSQYLYKKVQETMNISSESFSNASCQVNLSDPGYILQQQVQAEAANWSMYISLAGFLPNVIMTILFGIYSDHLGRRITFILPPIGSLLSTLADMAVITFDLPIPFLFLECIEYCFGGMMTLLMGVFAYIADTCEPEKRAFRMTVVDVMMLLVAAIGELAVGYLIKAQGFLPPLYYVVIGKIIVLIYAIFFIPETINRPQDELEESEDESDAKNINKSEEKKKTNKCKKGPNQATIFFGRLKIGLMLFVKDNGTGRQWKLLLLLASYLAADCFSTYKIMTLYELNSPLCWNSVLIGYFGAATMAIKSVVTLISSYVLRRVRMSEAWIAVIARTLSVLEYIYLAFVSTTAMMFIAPLLGSMSFMAIPMTRALMSNMVAQDQQGALFGVMTSGATIMSLVSTLSVNKIYAATLLLYRGFIFLFAAGVLSISLSLLLVFIGFTSGFGWLKIGNSPTGCCFKGPTKLSVQA